LRWTAPSWKRADTIIRECSQAVTLCMGFAPESVKDDSGERLWRSRRLFYWRTYDSATFDEWSTHKKDRIRPAVRQVIGRDLFGLGHATMAAAAFNTFDAVLSLGAVTDAGLCMECGGHRTRRRCACVQPEPRRRRAVVIPETDDTPTVAVEVPEPAELLGPLTWSSANTPTD